MATQHKRRYRRPARWGQVFERGGRQHLAIGLPGTLPSRTAVQLAAAPTAATLPVGLWHVSDYSAGTLAGMAPVIRHAVHVPTGAFFRLASLPDGPILAIEAADDAARRLAHVFWDDPAGWANRQTWRIGPPCAGVRP